MSILIKGLDMPKDFIGIELVFIPKDGDIINNESMSIGAERIIEIPTPHGRLIDADALEADFDRKWSPVNYDIIRDAPTILEAEE